MSVEPEANRGTVLVTGGTEGLGRAAAILLAQRGYRAFAGGRNAERRATLDQLARESKLPLEALELDVRDDTSVNTCISEIERRAGPVDVLVNNAGIAIGAAMEEISIDDLLKVYDTNVFGLLRVTKRVLPEMRRRRRGRIVNMSSIAGKVASPILGPYASSKHAVEAISDSLRHELYPFGIFVALIEPGYIETSMNRTARELSSAYTQHVDQSPYRGVYQAFLETWEKTRKASTDSPEDCARVILRAIEEAPPHPRYLVTRPAKIAAFMRRVMPDRTFDRGMRKQLGLDQLKVAMEKAAL